MRKICLLLLAVALMACTKSYKVASPDGKTVVRMSLTRAGEPMYSVWQDNKEVILPSRLGLQLADADLSCGLTVVSTARDSYDETWETVWGEERWIRNHYNELQIVLQSAAASRQFVVTLRVFDDGYAIRYTLPDGGDFVVTDDRMEYALADKDAAAWWISYRLQDFEGLYQRTPVAELRDTVASPLTVELSNGRYLCIHEAALTDWAAQNLYIEKEAQEIMIKTYLQPWSTGEKVIGTAPTSSGWHYVTIARDINALATSRIMLNLNEPCKIEDTSWIRPMKYVGIWWGMHVGDWTWHLSDRHGATTENTKRYIDFAAKHGFGGVLVEGWNKGWEGYAGLSDELFRFDETYPDWDIEELSRYAAEKGVKIIGHHETSGHAAHYEQQLDKAFAFAERYGIHDVKTGYVGGYLEGKESHKSQYAVRHAMKVVETAARYHVTIDQHEPAMLTGISRTYPNLMTAEGVRGAEWDAWCNDGGSPAEHNTVLPFTRGLAGPMDYTPGTFCFANPIYPGTRVHSTIAKQLALYVVLYSPLQMASDKVENYERKTDSFDPAAALRWLEIVPCDWQQSRIVDARIGDYTITARQDRNSEDWYIGAITDEQACDIEIPLSFLDQDVRYTATIWRDGESADWQSNPYDYIVETRQLTSSDTMAIHLAAGGGCAIRLSK